MAHFAGVRIFLAVVFPPANRAECHGSWRFEGSVAAAWAAEKSSYSPHARVDGKMVAEVYVEAYRNRR
jgi:hypothetical protein